MKNLLIIAGMLLSTNLSFYAQEKKSVKTCIAPTTIKIKDFIDSLSIEELLTILSVGKIKQLTDQPHIRCRLKKLEEQIEEAFNTLCTNELAPYNLSQEEYENIKYAFQQKAVLILYSLLYQRAKDLIDSHNDTPEKIILDFQLTPEELHNYLAQHTLS